MTRISIICLTAALVVACSGGTKQTTDKTMTDEQYGDAMAKEHATDNAQPSGAEQQSEGDLETHGEMVEYGTVDGQTVKGYLATPETDAPPTSAVIVIHEWWGLNDNIKTMTDKLASQGYVALAVDLYGKPAATKPEDAKKLMMASMEKPENGVANLKAAHEFLAKTGATKFGVIGWCFGGGWSLEAALTQGQGIDAVVMYYGRVKTKPEELKSLAAPLIGFFGAEDQGIPVDQVKLFEAALKSAGKDAEINVYDGANHAFANPSGDHYARAAAEDAWAKTLAFFHEHLG